MVINYNILKIKKEKKTMLNDLVIRNTRGNVKRHFIHHPIECTLLRASLVVAFLGGLI